MYVDVQMFRLQEHLSRRRLQLADAPGGRCCSTRPPGGANQVPHRQDLVEPQQHHLVDERQTQRGTGLRNAKVGFTAPLF